MKLEKESDCKFFFHKSFGHVFIHTKSKTVALYPFEVGLLTLKSNLWNQYEFISLSVGTAK